MLGRVVPDHAQRAMPLRRDRHKFFASFLKISLLFCSFLKKKNQKTFARFEDQRPAYVARGGDIRAGRHLVGGTQSGAARQAATCLKTAASRGAQR